MTKEKVGSSRVVKSKPQAIILDVLGPFAMKEFHILSKQKKEFYRGNIREFVNEPNSWKRKKGGHLKLHYQFAYTIQTQRETLPGEPKLVDPKAANREEQGKSLIDYILFSIDKNPTDGPTGLFLEYMQLWAYQRGSLKTAVYEDVPVAIKKWKDSGIQVLLNVVSTNVFERIVSATTRGNLRGFFSGHAQPDYTKKGMAAFENCKLVFPIQNVKSILFITHSAKAAAGAQDVGIPVVLIIRPDLDPDFDKRMHEEKKLYKPQPPTTLKKKGSSKDNVIGAFETGPLTEVAPLAAKSMMEAGASKIDIADIQSTIADSTKEAHEDMSSTIKYQDTQVFEVIKSLNDLSFK